MAPTVRCGYKAPRSLGTVKFFVHDVVTRGTES
jgi:hypothetical protein